MEDSSTTSDVNKILQILRRDRLDATYKFALLRGMIEVIDQAPFRGTGHDHEKGVFPMGLLVERWIYYYFPLVQQRIPQKHGEERGGKPMAFRSAMEGAIRHYDHVEDALTAFHHDYRRGEIKGEAAKDFIVAASKIAHTIANMPMKHLGYSANRAHYSVVKPSRKSFRKSVCDRFDEGLLRAAFGTYEISADYLRPLERLGAVIVGTESILYHWAEFTAGMARQDPSEVLKVLGERPGEERDVKEAREEYLSILRGGVPLECVWCGRPIDEKDLVVDHVIPFSLWGDNSLPNLMPCHRAENARKSDRIPAPELIERAGERIIEYMRILGAVGGDARKRGAEAGEAKLNAGLRAGERRAVYFSRAEQRWLSSLRERCGRLIRERGYEEWKG